MQYKLGRWLGRLIAIGSRIGRACLVAVTGSYGDYQQLLGVTGIYQIYYDPCARAVNIGCT
jgi:hypothetical protein